MFGPDPQYVAALQGFSSRVARELTILLYHGVTAESSPGVENFSCKHVPAVEFARHMEYLSRHCSPISMDEAERLCRENKPFPPRAVAITFDDAFANVYSTAYPVLKKWHLPFTFYVTTGMVETDAMFWVDAIEDCVNRAAVAEMRLSAFADALPLTCPEEKIAAIVAVKTVCKRSPAAVKDDIIKELARRTGVTPSASHAPNYLKIRWKELREMAADPLVILGGHGHTHDILSQISPATLENELKLSLKILREKCGTGPRHYAYPEGQAIHFNGAVIRVLKNHGVVCCPTAICGMNPQGTDPFQLKRVMVGFMGTPFPFGCHELK